MQTENLIEKLIACWPTRRAFAAEVGANVEAVHKWARAGRVPADWQAAVVKAAAARGLTFATAEWMLAVHDRSSEVRGAA
ncbi:hypothetical protein GQF56_11825 [Rhodobacter sphaeroides]|jgi:hypothetical protein|uniref:hypothetical protein n=1 Tax=Cereibacter sphaeroides TaxID=1063 RepID=UPI00136538E7|nr:hypothetical protein [Cereibacter sphaeroides]MVX48561.1 hypothetical protein [Cereibacter sphaeroides]